MTSWIARLALISILVVGLSLVAKAAPPGHTTTGLAPEAMRSELVYDIVKRWALEGAKRKDVSPRAWATLMTPLLQRASIANLERAASAVTFGSMNAALLGNNAMPNKLLGDVDADLVFTPVTTCRLVDTRIVGGPIAKGGIRSFVAFTPTDFQSQGGAASNCGLPADVAAVTVKITTALPPTYGYLTAYPSNEGRPLASSLNYFGDAHTSNEAVLRLCRPGCAKQFTLYTTQMSDVVVDVDGYFREPAATPLDCTVATQTGNLDLLAGLQTRSVSCPAGYTATGGGCGGPLGIGVSNSQPLVVGGKPTGWTCDLVGSLLSVISYQVNATCCRTPGH
ncbi:hypothetical protein [Lysobacter fragariae]